MRRRRLALWAVARPVLVLEATVDSGIEFSPTALSAPSALWWLFSRPEPAAPSRRMLSMSKTLCLDLDALLGPRGRQSSRRWLDASPADVAAEARLALADALGSGAQTRWMEVLAPSLCPSSRCLSASLLRCAPPGEWPAPRPGETDRGVSEPALRARGEQAWSEAFGALARRGPPAVLAVSAGALGAARAEAPPVQDWLSLAEGRGIMDRVWMGMEARALGDAAGPAPVARRRSRSL